MGAVLLVSRTPHPHPATGEPGTSAACPRSMADGLGLGPIHQVAQWATDPGRSEVHRDADGTFGPAGAEEWMTLFATPTPTCSPSSPGAENGAYSGVTTARRRSAADPAGAGAVDVAVVAPVATSVASAGGITTRSTRKLPPMPRIDT